MANDNNNIEAKRRAIQAAKERRKKRRNVEVVSCPGAFPISSRTKNNSQQQDDDSEASPVSGPTHHDSASVTKTSSNTAANNVVDWNKTVEEVRNLGATAFAGEEKRNYQDEQYELLTGRKRKKHQVPLPIVRGIKKKRAMREEVRLKEAKEAGIVLPKKSKESATKRGDNTSRVHGPAPSIGFMSKGVLRVKPKKW